jgi:signal transduction histidine kinase
MKFGERLQRMEYFLLLSVALIIASIVITIFHVRQKREATDLVIHTYNVIQEGNEIYTELLKRENDRVRYYVIGDTTIGKSFNEETQKLLNDLEQLKRTVELPEAIALVDNRIVPLINEKLNQEKIDLNNSKIPLDLSYQADQGLMNQIHDAFQKLESIKRSALVERQANLDRIYDFSNVFLLISFGLIGVATVIAWASLRSRQKEINHLVASLKEWNLSLEHKVEERTKEISAINEELLAINNEKDNFIGIVSHDLKSPITGIQNLVQLMKTQGASDIQQEYFELILESCSQMQYLISEILDVNRIEQGLQSVLTKKISVSELLTRIRKYFEVVTRDKNINLNFQLSENDILCTTDDALLFQILSNLISNAIKFSKSGSQVDLSVSKQSPNVVFEVTDYGPGIGDDEIPLLFKKFQKLKTRPTQGEGSTGLGLFIVNRLVQLLGGNVHVKSIPHQKTTFTVQIPE